MCRRKEVAELLRLARELVGGNVAKELVGTRDAALVRSIEEGDQVYSLDSDGMRSGPWTAEKPTRGGKAWWVISDRGRLHLVGLPWYAEVIEVRDFLGRKK